MPVLQAVVSDTVLADLDDAAIEVGVSRSRVAALALAAWLADPASVPALRAQIREERAAAREAEGSSRRAGARAATPPPYDLEWVRLTLGRVDPKVQTMSDADLARAAATCRVVLDGEWAVQQARALKQNP